MSGRSRGLFASDVSITYAFVAPKRHRVAAEREPAILQHIAPVRDLQSHVAFCSTSSTVVPRLWISAMIWNTPCMATGARPSEARRATISGAWPSGRGRPRPSAAARPRVCTSACSRRASCRERYQTSHDEILAVEVDRAELKAGGVEPAGQHLRLRTIERENAVGEEDRSANRRDQHRQKGAVAQRTTATIENSPWAKLTTLVARKIRTKPRATRA